MKFCPLPEAALLLALAVPALSSSIQNSGELKNILIEGVPRLEIKGDKPPYVPELDPLPAVRKALAERLNAPDATRKLMASLPNYLPSRLSSDIVLAPWHGVLVQPPVLDIYIKHPEGVKVASWRLLISDDQGKTFETLRGKGRIPDRLTWEGRGHSGDWLKVGHPYAYSYFVLDKSGVPTYVHGHSVLVKGLVERPRGRTSVTLDTKSVFDGGLKFTSWGRGALREAQDYLRRSANAYIDVEVYGDDVDLAQKQAEAVQKQLLEALHLRENRVNAKGRSFGRSAYARIELSAD